jgi:hypothetical protein
MGFLPQFGGDRIDALPFIYPQRRKPKLAPMGDTNGTPQLMKPGPRPRRNRMLGLHPQQPQQDIIHHCSKHSAFMVRVDAPAAVAGVGKVGYVADDFDSPWVGDGGRGDVHGNDEAGEEEHWSTIFAGPVAIFGLKCAVEFEAVTGGLSNCFRLRDFGEALPAQLIPKQKTEEQGERVG